MALVSTTGIVKDPIFLEHKPGYLHWESPQRLEVLYEMLTGRVPFQAKSFLTTLSQHVSKPPIPPRRR